MRIPQYQAWNHKLKKMQQALAIELGAETGGVMVWGKDYIAFESGEIDADRDFWSWDDCELRECTGLKDKNGKDIYRGDIVRGEHQDSTVVEWEQNIDTDRDWCFASGFEINLLNTSVNVLVGGSDFQHHLLNVEVIGNIYENPNLLEASQ